MQTVITCEHASSAIPARLLPEARKCFGSDALQSHVAYDLFAGQAAMHLSQKLGARCFMGNWSRLCIDLNRSLRNPAVWSELSHSMTETEKENWRNYHRTYRQEVQTSIKTHFNRGCILHISVHSFTPLWNGERRLCDVGLLYDPRKAKEKNLALELQKYLQDGGWKVRRNYPYRGDADGFTTALRKIYPDDRYLGLELELNQSLGPGMLKVVDLLVGKLKNL